MPILFCGDRECDYVNGNGNVNGGVKLLVYGVRVAHYSLNYAYPVRYVQYQYYRRRSIHCTMHERINMN